MLYTFLMEFRGGTYVDQVESNTIQTACKKWAKNIDSSAIKYFNERTRAKLLSQIHDKENKPTILRGLKNAFFTAVILGRHMAYIHIVITKN